MFQGSKLKPKRKKGGNDNGRRVKGKQEAEDVSYEKLEEVEDDDSDYVPEPTKRATRRRSRSGAKKKAKPDKAPSLRNQFGKDWRTRMRRALKRKQDQGQLEGLKIVDYGLGQSPGAFIVSDEDNTDNFKRAKKKFGRRNNKRERMLAGSPLERPKRSYEEERERQALRWTATCLLAMFPKGVEVQCYYDVSSNKVFISTNMRLQNKSMTKLFAEHGNDVIAAIGTSYEKLRGAGGRKARHVEKITQRSEGSPYPVQDAIFECLKAGRIEVIEASKEDGKGFHAERRIQKCLGVKLDPHFLGGVKRPCAVCAIALDLNGHVFPGPMWLSEAALHKMEPEDFIDMLADHVERCDAQIAGVQSYVSRVEDGVLDVGEDSMSDSYADGDEEVPKPEKKKKKRTKKLRRKKTNQGGSATRDVKKKRKRRSRGRKGPDTKSPKPESKTPEAEDPR